MVSNIMMAKIHFRRMRDGRVVMMGRDGILVLQYMRYTEQVKDLRKEQTWPEFKSSHEPQVYDTGKRGNAYCRKKQKQG